MSSNIYLQRDAPAYRIGHGVVLAYLTLFLFCGSALQWWYLARENRKRRRGDMDHCIEGKSKEEILMLGDQRYVPKLHLRCVFKLADSRPDRTSSTRLDTPGLYVILDV